MTGSVHVKDPVPGDRLSRYGIGASPGACQHLAVAAVEPVQIALEIPHDDVLTQQGRTRKPAPEKRVVLPDCRSIAGIDGPQVAFIVGDVNLAPVSADARIRGEFPAPQHHAGVFGNRSHFTLVGTGKDNTFDHQGIDVDIHHAFQFRAAAGSRDTHFPAKIAADQIHRGQFSVGQSHDGAGAADNGGAVAVQTQHRHGTIIDPQ